MLQLEACVNYKPVLQSASNLPKNIPGLLAVPRNSLLLAKMKLITTFLTASHGILSSDSWIQFKI